MTTDKPKVAGYGLHYHANNQLIANTTDRIVFQSLVDVVRKQLATSLDNQTVMLSVSQLSRLTAVERTHGLPSSLKRLEALGLIKRYKNGILINCDEYVTLIQLYETLSVDKRNQLTKDFAHKGVAVLNDYNTCANLHSRAELLGISGSSIILNNDYLCKSSQLRANEAQTCENIHNHLCKSSQFHSPEVLSCEDFHTFDSSKNCEILHSLADLIAKMVHSLSFSCSFEEFYTAIACENFHSCIIEALKVAYTCGKFPNSFLDDLKNLCKSSQLTCANLHNLAQKTVKIFTTVIIEDKLKNEVSPTLKNEAEDENFQDSLQKGFESFSKVEVLDFSKPSVDIEDNLEDMAEADYSQQVLKRAERSMRAKNSYRNKPFLKVEKVKEIVDCLDEVVKSPVDFFIYQFWWGIFDLYCDHYHPSNKIDEQGEAVDDSQLVDWKEMIGAPLPQDEIYALAKNVYEDLVGAVEQGRYVYGDNNEWVVKFSFDSFEDFMPYEIFQWSPCTMQDKSVPALRVAIDRFYDIEAKDVFTPSRGDKKVKNAQNKKLVQLVLSTEDSQLTPMEAAVKAFYRDFVVTGEENIIDDFTDGRGTALESGGGLPDHLLRPWCYSLPSVGYNEFTSVLSTKYKPCDGVHKRAYIFSAESVVEWNERNGYYDTVAHQAL